MSENFKKVSMNKNKIIKNKSVEKKNTKKRTINKKEEYDDKWIYILLLSTIVILLESMKNYTFSVGEIDLSYSLFLLPIVYFLINYITKKKGFKPAVLAISISSISMVLFVMVMNFITGIGFNFSNVIGDFCGYIVSQYVGITIYEFLIDNISTNYLLVFLNYMFVLIANYLFYSLFNLNILNFETYWIGYFSTLLLQSVFCFILAYIDTQIKRGV